ncbi:MAG: hypothetical protein WAN44_11215 [Propionibacteriaceae bacterium]
MNTATMGRTRKENMMAKYLPLKPYRGGPASAMDWAPIDRWTPDEVDAHVQSEAARSAPSLPERDHLTRQAARLNAQLRS